MKFAEHINEYLHKIAARREEYLRAWYAETLVPPSEAMLMQQDMGTGITRMWVEARPDNLPRAVFSRRLPKGVA